MSVFEISTVGLMFKIINQPDITIYLISFSVMSPLAKTTAISS